jgi:hypothetical protein
MLSLTTFATNNGVVAGVLQKALAERGVAIISDGDKFVMVVPADRAPTVKPYSQDLKPDKDTAEIPAHAVNFAGVDIDQVADVYCRLNNRKLDASVPFPHLERHDITFTNVQMLSKAEIIYALDTLIEWSGFTLEPVGEDKMQPVAIPGEKKLNTDSQVKSY